MKANVKKRLFPKSIAISKISNIILEMVDGVYRRLVNRLTTTKRILSNIYLRRLAHIYVNNHSFLPYLCFDIFRNYYGVPTTLLLL